jgi:hypothetical protein
VASVIGSLAWPSVITVLLIILRREIVSLAQRLQEISLPGGTKATFEKQLQEARVIEATSSDLPKVEKTGADENQLSRIVPETSESRFLRLLKISPEAAVMDAYQQIESLLVDKIAPFVDGVASSPSAVMDILAKRELSDDGMAKMFKILRNARNVAAHGSGRGITSEEALDYWEHVKNLKGRLYFILGQLDAKSKYEAKK